jgi:hypothetical protein
LSLGWTVLRFSIEEWVRRTSSPIAWSSSLLTRLFCFHCLEVGFLFMFLVVGFSERGRII